MADQHGARPAPPRPGELSKAVASVAAPTQRVLGTWMSRNGLDAFPGTIADPLNIGGAFFELTARLLSYPAQMVRAQVSLWSTFMSAWQSTTHRMIGLDDPFAGDGERRSAGGFDPTEGNELFDLVQQAYLLAARWLKETVHDVGSLEPAVAERIGFCTREFVARVPPAVFVRSHPGLARATVETSGNNLVDALNALLTDLERGAGLLRPRSDGRPPYVIGNAIATAPGKVVFRNRLMELIQYAPTTPTAHPHPVLFVPPWTHRAYVADLRPKMSWVRWAVGRGHTVFAVSWAAPAGADADGTITDYVDEGVTAAIDAAYRAAGGTPVNLVGYCLGGILAAIAAARLAAGGDGRVASLTLLASLLDHAERDALGGIIDEAMLELMSAAAPRRGGKRADAAAALALMRENDLVWSLVVGHFAGGEQAFPHEIVHWNSDARGLPGTLHTQYLVEVFGQNRLARPGALVVGGTPVDLAAIEAPTYVLGLLDDHVAPWRAVYAGSRLTSGPSRFVLAGSGHVAGVFDAATARRCGFRAGGRASDDADDWLTTATFRHRSWWTDWDAWLKRAVGGARVPARKPGSGGLSAIADAPGPNAG